MAGESILQIEDIVVYKGKDLWSRMIFSERWKKLNEFWQSLPPDQPLLAFKPRVVTPIPLSQWNLNYDSTVYWIIQPDHYRQPRWYWKDTVTIQNHKPVEFIAPVLKRGTDILNILVAYLAPYAKAILPDTYSLFSQEGVNLGVASISTLNLSIDIRKAMTDNVEGIPVEVKWNDSFNKYQVVRIMPENTPITTASFFYHKTI